MGVPCPGCGRSYDEARFRLGRTLHCRCGHRVGLGPESGPEARRPDAGRSPRFLADAMLGRLARWLRILGHDTACPEPVSDEALVRRALEEERIILTTDRALPEEWTLPRVAVLRSGPPLAQLAELAERMDLVSGARPFCRCSRCNAELESAGRAAARGHVPAAVLERFERFRICPACRRFYWPGSHADRMREALARTLGTDLAAPAEDRS
jgi:uncharacterized protein with PIN domain